MWVKKFRDLPIFQAKDVKTKFYVTKTTFWKKFSWEKDTNIYLFMASLMKIWLARKIQVYPKGILGVQRNISGKNFLEERKFFLLLCSERESLGFLAKQNWQSCQNCIPNVQKYSFIFYRRKTWFWFCSQTLREKIPFFATFGHGCRTRILRVERPYWKKSRIRFIFNFPEFWRKLWFALKNSRFVKRDLTLQEKNSLGKTKSSTYTALREELTVVCQNMTGRFAANALPATREAIWRKRLLFSHKNITLNIFSDSERRRSKIFSIFPPRV